MKFTSFVVQEENDDEFEADADAEAEAVDDFDSDFDEDVSILELCYDFHGYVVQVRVDFLFVFRKLCP